MPFAWDGFTVMGRTVKGLASETGFATYPGGTDFGVRTDTDMWGGVENLKYGARGPAFQPPPPTGLTAITTGSGTIASAIAANSTGTFFGLDGAYTNATGAVPKVGQRFYNTGKTTVTASSEYGFNHNASSPAANNVEYHGLTITGANTYQIWARSTTGTKTYHCDLSGGEFVYHDGDLGGSALFKTIVRDGRRMGARLSSNNNVLEDCELTGNNSTNEAWNAGSALAAASKQHSSPGCVNRWNWIYLNNGPGLWSDNTTADATWTAHHNLIETHWQRDSPGIMYETGTGGVKLHMNVIKSLQFAAFWMSECEDATVEYNKVVNCYRGLINREGARAANVNNGTFQWNYVDQTDLGGDDKAAGWVNNEVGSGNVWEHNRYRIESGIANPFRGATASQTVAQWQANSFTTDEGVHVH